MVLVVKKVEKSNNIKLFNNGAQEKTELIKLDYLTITALDKSLRKFFFKVLKKLKKQLSKESNLDYKKYKMHWGGESYKGWIFNESGRGGWFIGSRSKAKSNSTEYIVTIPGEKADFFGKELLKNVGEDWHITRVDVQSTFEYENPNQSPMNNKESLRKEYSLFYEAQKKLEQKKPKNRQKKVYFEDKPKYLSVHVGRKKAGGISIKVYSRITEYSRITKNPKVRVEMMIKDKKTIQQLFKKSCWSLHTCNEGNTCSGNVQAELRNLMAKSLCTLASTRFLKKHKELLNLKANNQKSSSSRARKEAARNEFQKNLIVVAKAHQNLVKVLKPKMADLSHKQMAYLNEKFAAKDWRISWQNAQQWALIPTQSNKLWSELFTKFPTRTNEYIQAIERRQAALLEMAEYIEKVAKHCQSLPTRKKPYIREPRRNPLIRQLFQYMVEYSPIDSSIKKLPTRKNNDFCFADKAPFLQDFIRRRFQQKKKV